MMKNFIFLIILFILFFSPLSQAVSQQSSSESSSESLVIFDTNGFPQWAKDMRRFDIIAFGTLPFSLFFVNFVYDLYRWINFAGMDFSAQGRMYAPWPLTSAGGIEKTSAEIRNTIIISAGISIILAVVDLIIHKNRQSRENTRIQNMPPSGSFNIIINPNENTETEIPDETDESPLDYPLDLDETLRGSPE